MRRKIGHEFTSGPFYYMHFCNCSRNPTTRAAGAEGIFSRWHCFPSLRISECPCVPQEPEARPGQDSPKGAAGALPPPGPEPQKEDRGGGGRMYGAYGELCLFRHVATFSFVAQLRWRAATERAEKQPATPAAKELPDFIPRSASADRHQKQQAAQQNI